MIIASLDARSLGRAFWRGEQAVWQFLDSPPRLRLGGRMKIVKFISVLFGVLVCLVVYLWFRPPSVVIYSYEDLVGVTCATLRQKHEEVITSHHDAALDYFHRKGEFPVGLGLPPEEQLPFALVLQRYVQEEALPGFDVSQPFRPSASELHARFDAEVSRICASHPEMLAWDAGHEAAERLELR